MSTSTFKKDIFLQEETADKLATDLESATIVKETEAKYLKVISLKRIMK